MLAYGPTARACCQQQGCKAQERQSDRVGRFHLASIPPDCGIRRTARANPCRMPAPGIRFQDGPLPTAFPDKDAPAGFPESWGAAHDHTNKRAAQKAVSEFQLASRTYPADERERAFPPSG